MYKACLFDLDGTLADTLESIAHVANIVLSGFGLPAQPVEDYKYYAGDGADVLMERCMRAAGGNLEKLDEARAMYRSIFADDPLYKVTPFDGMMETLLELKKRGVKLAVCSNKPHPAAVGAIRGLFGDELFDIVQGQEPSIPRKPAPDGALLIAKRLQVDVKECMYVGDTNTDMQTGNAAGMLTIGVLWGFRDRKELVENHAHRIISHPSELLAIQEENEEKNMEVEVKG